MTRDEDHQSRGLLARLLRRRREEPELPSSGMFTARSVPPAEPPAPAEPPEERLFSGVDDAWTRPREEQPDEPPDEPEPTSVDGVEETAADEATLPTPTPTTPADEPEAAATGTASLADLADELHRYVTEAPTDDVWDEEALPGARVPESAGPEDAPRLPPDENLFRTPRRSLAPEPSAPTDAVDDTIDVLERDWPEDEPAWVDAATEPAWDPEPEPEPSPAPAASTEPPRAELDDTDLQAAAAAALWEHEDEDAPAASAAETTAPPEPDPHPEPEPETQPEATVPAPSEPGATEPDAASQTRPEPEAPAPPPVPEVARVPIGEEPPIHGPKQIRVYDDRLDRRPGPIQMSPSEAVALAKDGPEALQRRRARED